MKIGILGAMLEEISAIKALMIIHHETHIGGRTYYEGSINTTEVVLTGVAGAVDTRINLGDIVIDNGLYQRYRCIGRQIDCEPQHTSRLII